jgi:hypothetical protein
MILFVGDLCKLIKSVILTYVLFPSTTIINIAPRDVYYHSDDLLIRVLSISMPFALNFG